MGDEFSVDPDALRAAAGYLDEHAGEVVSHGETLGAHTAGPVGRGPIGEVIDAAVRRGLAVAAHDITGAVAKFYAGAAALMRKTAVETERVDGETGQTFDELGGQPAAEEPIPAGRGQERIHSRYADGTPVYDSRRPGKIKEPDPAADGAPHTRLQWDAVNGRPYKAREYAQGGIPMRDIDFTIPTFPNGSPRPGHRAPEQHRWIPNDPGSPAAGYRRGPGEPLETP
jgi:hypothetical protein